MLVDCTGYVTKSPNGVRVSSASEIMCEGPGGTGVYGRPAATQCCYSARGPYLYLYHGNSYLWYYTTLASYLCAVQLVATWCRDRPSMHAWPMMANFIVTMVHVVVAYTLTLLEYWREGIAGLLPDVLTCRFGFITCVFEMFLSCFLKSYLNIYKHKRKWHTYVTNAYNCWSKYRDKYRDLKGSYLCGFEEDTYNSYLTKCL